MTALVWVSLSAPVLAEGNRNECFELLALIAFSHLLGGSLNKMSSWAPLQGVCDSEDPWETIHLAVAWPSTSGFSPTPTACSLQPSVLRLKSAELCAQYPWRQQ